tara:strand:- start:1205 stop:1420 length:216 start_codon:yes stop_codon:yes gene_type:complete
MSATEIVLASRASSSTQEYRQHLEKIKELQVGSTSTIEESVPCSNEYPIDQPYALRMENARKRRRTKHLKV